MQLKLVDVILDLMCQIDSVFVLEYHVKQCLFTVLAVVYQHQ